MIEKSLRSQQHGFRVRQPEMPGAFHLLPARKALFRPAQNRRGNASHDRAFLALSELRGEHGYRSASRRQSVIGFTPSLWKHVAA
jgi:hypothetical protein